MSQSIDVCPHAHRSLRRLISTFPFVCGRGNLLTSSDVGYSLLDNRHHHVYQLVVNFELPGVGLYFYLYYMFIN